MGDGHSLMMSHVRVSYSHRATAWSSGSWTTIFCGTKGVTDEASTSIIQISSTASGQTEDLSSLVQLDKEIPGRPNVQPWRIERSPSVWDWGWVPLGREISGSTLRPSHVSDSAELGMGNSQPRPSGCGIDGCRYEERTPGLRPRVSFRFQLRFLKMTNLLIWGYHLWCLHMDIMLYSSCMGSARLGFGEPIFHVWSEQY